MAESSRGVALWRVLERSQLVVQIVDARNPLVFRSTDLERYVRELDPRKRCLLLVNKADLLTKCFPNWLFQSRKQLATGSSAARLARAVSPRH